MPQLQEGTLCLQKRRVRPRTGLGLRVVNLKRLNVPLREACIPVTTFVPNKDKNRPLTLPLFSVM